MCDPFFHEFRVIPSANGFQLVFYTEPVFVNLWRSPRIDSQPDGPVRQPYLSYRPAMLLWQVESNTRNRFMVSWNVYKYGLCYFMHHRGCMLEGWPWLASCSPLHSPMVESFPGTSRWHIFLLAWTADEKKSRSFGEYGISWQLFVKMIKQVWT